MAKFANDDDLIPGLGMPSIHSGPWDMDTKRRDVRDVYRSYAEEVVGREGKFTPQVCSDDGWSGHIIGEACWATNGRPVPASGSYALTFLQAIAQVGHVWSACKTRWPMTAMVLDGSCISCASWYLEPDDMRF